MNSAPESHTLTLQRRQGLNILLTIYVALIVLSVVGGTKTATVFDRSYLATVYTYMCTYVVLDLVSRLYDEEYAKEFVLPGIITMIGSALITFFFVQLEPSANFVEKNIAYTEVLSPAWIFVLSGIIAYVSSQTFNIWLFSWLDKHSKKMKSSGASNPVSSFVSHAIDTGVFLLAAFTIAESLNQDIFGENVDLLDVFLTTLGIKIAFLVVLWPLFVFIVSRFNRFSPPSS